VTSRQIWLEGVGAKVGSLASLAGDTLRTGGARIGDAVSELQRLCIENPIAVGAMVSRSERP
jgi:hypothetical protein